MHAPDERESSSRDSTITRVRVIAVNKFKDVTVSVLVSVGDPMKHTTRLVDRVDYRLQERSTIALKIEGYDALEDAMKR